MGFKNETIDAFNSEHLGKVTIDGEVAEEEINYSISLNDEGVTTIIAGADGDPDDIYLFSKQTKLRESGFISAGSLAKKLFH